MNRIKRISFMISGVSILLCLGGVVFNRPQFFISYLFAFLFWFGLVVGCLGILLLHNVTGGAWGDLIRPPLQSASRTLPLIAVLFVPLLFGLRTLFPWARPELVAADVLLQHKHVYLNVPFFCGRAVFYFVILGLLAYRMRPGPRSAPGLILYMLTLSFAAIDWMMSLEPDWYSTIYAVMVIIGQALTAFGFVTIALCALQNPRGRTDANFLKPYWDLGNMLLAFVMLSAYLAFSQYLIIWSANIPEEIPWYLHRQTGGWFGVVLVLIVFQFFLPFLILLGRHNKQRLDRLAWVAGLLWVLGAVNTYWLVQPAFFPGRFHIHWLDLAAFLGVGGLWLGAFVVQLQKQPQPIGLYVPEEVK